MDEKTKLRGDLVKEICQMVGLDYKEKQGYFSRRDLIYLSTWIQARRIKSESVKRMLEGGSNGG